jgi:YidC/Oxa1 family membrane protein insertase
MTGRLPSRFQSTASNVTPIAEVQPDFAPSQPPISGNPSSEFFSTPLDDITSSVGPPVYEHLGFLKEMGLDYGWGPTAFMETLLEHVHIYAGTPWWASIAISMVVIRAALLKFYFDAADTSARNALISSYNTPINDRYKAAAVAQDAGAMREASAEMKELRAAAGIKLWKLWVPFIQIPIGFGTFRLMRGMAHLPVPGFDTGGLLWVHDLTLSDPTFVLPAVTSIFYYMTFKVSIATFTNYEIC